MAVAATVFTSTVSSWGLKPGACLNTSIHYSITLMQGATSAYFLSFYLICKAIHLTPQKCLKENNKKKHQCILNPWNSWLQNCLKDKLSEELKLFAGTTQQFPLSKKKQIYTLRYYLILLHQSCKCWKRFLSVVAYFLTAGAGEGKDCGVWSRVVHNTLKDNIL